MTERETKETKGKPVGKVVIVTATVLLALIGAAAGGGDTVEIPATSWNISAGGSVGNKHDLRGTVPDYLTDREGSHDNFINETQSVNLGPFGLFGILVIGEQTDSPNIGLNVDLDH